MLIVGPDPDWQQRSQQRITDSINLFLNLQERKKTDRDNERQRHMAMLGEHPELADGDYGTTLLKKYGHDDPLSSMVMTIRHRAALEEQSLEGVKEYARAIGDETGRRAGERAAIAGMEDTVPTFGNAGPGLFRFIPVPAPNTEKQERASAFEQLPDVTQSALERMSPEKRAAAMAWMAINKTNIAPKFQEGFDPKSLPEAQRGLRAAGVTATDPRMTTAAEVAAGGKASQRELQLIEERAAKQAENQAKNQAAIDERARQAGIRAKLLQNQRDAAAAARQTKGQEFTRERDKTKAAEKETTKKSPWEKGARQRTLKDIDENVLPAAATKDTGLPMALRPRIRGLVMNILDETGDEGAVVAVTNRMVKSYTDLAADPKYQGKKPSELVDILEQEFASLAGHK